MRDYLCNEKKLLEDMDDNLKYIKNNEQKIEPLKIDCINRVQRYPLPPEKIIENLNKDILRMYRELINGRYSFGDDCDEIKKDYIRGFEYLKIVPSNRYGYVNGLQYLCMGILFGVSNDKLQMLINKFDEAHFNDKLIDFIAQAFGLKRAMISNGFEKEKPYSRCIEIAKMAQTDKTEATKMLVQYVEKEWLKGHSDYGWPTFHKEVFYVGLWSYEAAVIARIFDLDDSSLKDNNHYPYDLAHYKNNLEFNDVIIPTETSKEDEPKFIEGIEQNPTIESVIPAKYHEYVNQIIVDYNTISAVEFWKKYSLDQIWFLPEEFEKDKESDLLGTLIVFLLAEQRYILQLDYKDDLEDNIDRLENQWNEKDTKIIQFEIDNDQCYYARIPKDNEIVDIYEVKIAEIE